MDKMFELIFTSIEKAFEIKGMPFSEDEKKQWLSSIADALELDLTHSDGDEDNFSKR